jgi:hypothetical protein
MFRNFHPGMGRALPGMLKVKNDDARRMGCCFFGMLDSPMIQHLTKKRWHAFSKPVLFMALHMGSFFRSNPKDPKENNLPVF